MRCEIRRNKMAAATLGMLFEMFIVLVGIVALYL